MKQLRTFLALASLGLVAACASVAPPPEGIIRETDIPYSALMHSIVHAHHGKQADQR